MAEPQPALPADSPEGVIPIRLFDPETNQPLEPAPEHMAPMILAGKAAPQAGEQIPVINPSGKPVFIASDHIHQALQSGYQLDTPDLQLQRIQQKQYGEGVLPPVGAALAGAARGATAGVSDYALTQSGLVAPQTLQALEKHQPTASTAGFIGGIAGPGLLTGSAEGTALRAAAEILPSSLIAKLGKGVAEQVGRAVGSEGTQSLAKTIVQQSLPRLAGSVTEGALYGAGNALSETSLGDTELTAQKLASEVGFGVLVGGGIGAAASGAALAKAPLTAALSKVTEATKEGVKRLIPALAGATKEDIEQYLAHSPAVNDAPKSLDVKHAIDTHVEQAKNVLAETRYAHDVAESAYDRAARSEMERLKSVSPQSVRQEVLGAVDQVAEERNALSAKSYELLEGQPGAFDLSRYKKEIQNKLEELGAHTSDAHSSAAGGLSRYAERIQALPDQVPFSKVKELVQDLDKDTQDYWKAQRFGSTQAPGSDLLDRARVSLRRSLDADLKNLVPEYEQVMKLVSQRSELLSNLRNFNTEEKAISTLARIGSEKGRMIDLKNLESLEEFTGKDFSKPLAEYLNAKRILGTKSLQEAHLASLPESIKLRELQPKLEYAKAEFEKVKHLTPASTERIIKQAVNDSNAESIKALHALPKSLFGGQDMGAMLKNMKTQQAFEKGATNGSRHVNLWAMLTGGVASSIGAAVGGAVGGVHGAALGISAGAALGATLDKYGPAVVKKTLDAYIKLSNIEAMNLAVTKRITQNVKGFLASEALPRALDKTKVPASIQILDQLHLGGKKDRSSPSSSLDLKKGASRARQDSFWRLFQDISHLIANPEVFSQSIADQLKDLHAVAPGVGSALSQTTAQAAQFLYEKAPKSAQSKYSLIASDQKFYPSDSQIAQWERYVVAVEKPMTVLDDLRHGRLSHEGVETLKTIYPKIYSEAVSSMVEALSSHKGLIPFQKRLQISLFMGMPVDYATDPQFVSQMQEIHSNFGVQSNIGQGSVKMGGAQSQPGQSLKTDTEKALTRA